jgi:hypothetical protein
MKIPLFGSQSIFVYTNLINFDGLESIKHLMAMNSLDQTLMHF